MVEPDVNDDEDILDEAAAQDEVTGLEIHEMISNYGADYQVDGLVKRLNAENIKIPPFQRKFVWTKPQASRFIESLLLGFPVPGIFLAKRGNAPLLVVDGQQRLKTLQMFYHNRWSKDGTWENGDEQFDLVGVESEFEGTVYDKLETDDKQRLDDALIRATIVQETHGKQSRRAIYSLFERLNTGGTLLQPQEIRSSIYHGRLSALLMKLNENEAWREIYGPESKRMKDQELILRFFTLYFRLDQYERPMKDALNSFMGDNANLEEHSDESLTRLFEGTIAAIYDALGGAAFRPERSLNAAVFDAVMVGVASALANGRTLAPGDLKDSYETLVNDPNFQKAYKKSTADDEQVKTRIRLAKAAFGGQ